MLKSLLKFICKLSGVLGALFILGSIGACENFSISIWQMFIQAIIGAVIIFISYLVHQIINCTLCTNNDRKIK